ncbi:uncharacterized protein LOC133517478 [Cydia pomonella]|uniref:uncharacterized protein LOC133517478 n=1 Tax=Cydia pomonella TaxID=82600 RepID=UPI002ADE1818|nr:uncharacterized protein LOC133517478 [Cydia pomonella]
MAARSLAESVARVVSENSFTAWEHLLTFAYKNFHIPHTKSNRTLTAIIKDNLSHPSFPVANPTDTPNTIDHNAQINPKYKCRIIEQKISDGNLKGATRLLFSSDTLASYSPAVLSALQDKHPVASASSLLPSPPGPPAASLQPLQVTKAAVLHAVLSFPAGSAGGLDGITPQHLKDLTGPLAGDAGETLLEELTALTNLMLAGKVCREVVPILYGANLIALKKKDGGIRPIAVGNTFRRLTSKICCREFHSRLTEKFKPIQLGFGLKGGCEGAVHAARSFIDSPNFEILVKIDVRNAFNSIDRGVLLTQVEKELPEIYGYLWQCYGSASSLMYKNMEIPSCVGCQQGDPLGPVIFSLAIHPIINQLTSNLNFWYLDDGTIGGKKSTVLADLRTLNDRFAEIGLAINYDKCELFISDAMPPDTKSSLINDINLITPNISVLSRDTLTLLGAPILEEAIPLSINGKVEQFNKCSQLLHEINPHMAIYILRLCLFSPRFLYILRCAPVWKFPLITSSVDNILRETVSKILNVSFTPSSWTQATLPIKFGGLGIRLAGDLALPAFLSSAYSTFTLVRGILRIPSTANVLVSCLADAESAWEADHSVEQVPGEKMSQAAWDVFNVKRNLQLLLHNSPNHHERARLMAVSEKESGYWLHALPSRNLGSALEPSTLRIAVCLRLGLRICEPHTCSRCIQPVDTLGRHGLHCKMSAGRLYRHATLNDLIRRALSTASLPATLEPSGLCAADGKRPDGCTLVPWSLGRPLAWDATCVDTLAPSYVEGSARKPGTAVDQAQTAKRRKYAFLSNEYEFAALAMETLGPWSSDTKNFVREVSVRLIGISGDHRAGAFFAQRLSLAVQRGNAASVLATMPEGSDLGEIFYI